MGLRATLSAFEMLETFETARWALCSNSCHCHGADYRLPEPSKSPVAAASHANIDIRLGPGWMTALLCSWKLDARSVLLTLHGNGCCHSVGSRSFSLLDWSRWDFIAFYCIVSWWSPLWSVHLTLNVSLCIHESYSAKDPYRSEINRLAEHREIIDLQSKIKCRLLASATFRAIWEQ